MKGVGMQYYYFAPSLTRSNSKERQKLTDPLRLCAWDRRKTMRLYKDVKAHFPSIELQEISNTAFIAAIPDAELLAKILSKIPCDVTRLDDRAAIEYSTRSMFFTP